MPRGRNGTRGPFLTRLPPFIFHPKSKKIAAFYKIPRAMISLSLWLFLYTDKKALTFLSDTLKLSYG
jgi:hypothetical protein